MAYAYERLGQLEKARLALDLVMSQVQRAEPLAHLGLVSIALQRGDLDGAARSLASAKAARGAARRHLRGFRAVSRPRCAEASSARQSFWAWA
ncbi:MAG: hypothetical protein ABJC63_12325 [Gemmatimonadales bacterium]